MTAAELIELLSAYPSDLQVLVEGYETGYDHIKHVEQKNVERYRHAQDWDGQYQESKKGGKPCILIRGRLGYLR
ncbi:hypothetical protein SAMN05216296_1992 [Pseudomonas pohangensis]|uniref:Uncharacterized protein n=1 Tax=Pseudomonas pohangensis TaxID=364197 RepID=A0A1H2G2N3_9PSED|nr:hypothetical protein [Pseudomonas pohangensis]SDU13834.1 hypothetical protein SAMN05216296_1992 [Pseudomonas pohangensis]